MVQSKTQSKLFIELNGLQMRVLIEHTSDNKQWQVNIEDMFGKRPYVSTKFDNPDRALGYIKDEFRDCSDFECEINGKLNDDRDKSN